MESDPGPHLISQESDLPGRGRPAVPRAIAMEILLEAGHRCAVCGESTPLERAHIIPWRTVKEHTADNLICLCANCHQRADSENWGESTLREYKRNPWIRRRFDSADNTGPVAKVELTIDMELKNFDETQQLWLRHALASFLNINPSSVKITSLREGSVKITVEVPQKAKEELLEAHEKNRPELARYFKPLDLVAVKELQSEEHSVAKQERKSSSWEDREDNTIYKVVINHEEQYSIWPAHRENPLGWRDAGKSGVKQECLDYIKEVWTDMRPLSLRRQEEKSSKERNEARSENAN